MSEKLTTNIISLLEQFEASVTNIAPIISSYYLGMIKNGIPHELAEQLIMDWHHIFWSSQFPSKQNQDE